MELGPKGKTALVLGGGGGLGGAITKTLAGEGAQVAVADINLQVAEKTVCDIVAVGGVAMVLTGARLQPFTASLLSSR